MAQSTRHRFTAAGAFAFLALAATGVFGAADTELLNWTDPPGSPPFLIAEGRAGVLGPAEHPLDGIDQQPIWDEAGRYLALCRTVGEPPRSVDPLQRAAGAPPAYAELHYWNRDTGAVQKLLGEPRQLLSIADVVWLHGGTHLLVHVRIPAPQQPDHPEETVLLRITRTGRRVERLPVPGEGAVIETAPGRAVAAIWNRRQVWIAGRTGAPVDLSGALIPLAGNPFMVWRAEYRGQELHLELSRTMGDSKPFWAAVSDFGSGRARILGARRPQAVPPATSSTGAPLLQAGLVAGTLKVGKEEFKASPALLTSPVEGPRTKVLLAPDARFVSLAPDREAVAYISGEGACSVRRIHWLDIDEFLAARKKAIQNVLLNQGRHTGAALVMYSQDYDEMLPPAGNLLGPYMRDRAMLNSFLLTMAGGNVSDISEPGKTEAGYFPGPGGRAIVFIDGHVEWRPD